MRNVSCKLRKELEQLKKKHTELETLCEEIDRDFRDMNVWADEQIKEKDQKMKTL